MKSFWDELPRPFFILAPMEAVTDVVFRHVVAAAAPPDAYFTEFTNATGWAHAGDKAIGGRLVKTDDEHPIVAHLWGSDPSSMEKLAQHCAKLGFDSIDINMGCPDSSATKSGGGAGMIRDPENAAAIIAAAKTSGLAVSVKTRLGYTYVDEWREWLAHLLRQDVVNLTIHLRTKKEMSKVDAHHELIPEIKKLRDEIAPQTLLTINGDIRDRAHGMELVEKYGVDGIMIGRGIFHNPFAFAIKSTDESSRFDNLSSSDLTQPTPPGVARERDETVDGAGERDSEKAAIRKERLLSLLKLQLDLYDQYHEQTNRPFDTLKRFFKIYVRDFPNASEFRDKLMHTKNTDEVRALIETTD